MAVIGAPATVKLFTRPKPALLLMLLSVHTERGGMPDGDEGSLGNNVSSAGEPNAARLRPSPAADVIPSMQMVGLSSNIAHPQEL